MPWTAPYALKATKIWNCPCFRCCSLMLFKGLNVEILDEKDQFLKLWHGSHVGERYVRTAIHDLKDNYVIPCWPWPIKQSPKNLAAAHFPFGWSNFFSWRGLAYYPLIRTERCCQTQISNFRTGHLYLQSQLTWKLITSSGAFSEDVAVLVEKLSLDRSTV